MLNKKTVEDFNFKGKRALVRVDFNVPLKNGEIVDDNRIRAALPTIEYLKSAGAKIILMSHLGRPKGEPKPEFSLEAVARRLSELLNVPVKFLASDKVVDDSVKQGVEALKDGQICLLQNTRYRKEETKNEPNFAKELASLGDIFVNDAFGTCHRAHCSNVGVSEKLPSCVGYLVQKEIDVMDKALESPERPFIAILGGAKVSDKIGVIENLLEKVDTIIIGGAMAYTFLKAEGKNVGKSLLEEDKIQLAKDLMSKSAEKGVKLLLPLDLVVAKEMTEQAKAEIVDVDHIKDDDSGFDIGPKTVQLFKEEIEKAKTVIWNGPLGVFEIQQFSTGTFEIAKALSEVDAVTIIGGGDSASAIEKAGYKDKVTHVSTGGGASLEFLEGKELPGIAAIENK